MVPNRRRRKGVLLAYLQANRKDIRLFSFVPQAINWRKKSVIGLYRQNHQWKTKRFALPQVVYNRCYRSDPKLIKRLEKTIGKNKCFNQMNRFNKQRVYEILMNSAYVEYLPEVSLYTKEDPLHLLERFSGLYFKPFYGSSGKGVYRVCKTEENKIHISQNYFAPEITLHDPSLLNVTMQNLIGNAKYIIQRGIEVQQLNDHNFDVRVLVQKDNTGLWSITSMISRVAYKESFNTSICEQIYFTKELLQMIYSIEEVNVLLASFYKMSLEIASFIEQGLNNHLGEISIDYALDEWGYIWIIEVNGMPQKNFYKEMGLGLNVYKKPLDYCSYLTEH